MDDNVDGILIPDPHLLKRHYNFYLVFLQRLGG
jgi:hypothetical protein